MAGKTICLVEDEDAIALALEFLIGRQGHRVVRLADGAGALEAIRAAQPDLVLLDIVLPGRSGFDICQALRNDRHLQNTRIVLMSARGGPLEQRKGLALGADAFLAKPFSKADLIETIASQLDGGANG